MMCARVFLFLFFTVAKTSPVETQGLYRIASNVCTLEMKANKSFLKCVQKPAHQGPQGHGKESNLL